MTDSEAAPHSKTSDETFFDKFSQPGLWEGGYFEGNPLDPMSPSSYGVYGYNSSLYTVYSACIRPYVGVETTALEIGPSRGAWTKAILARGCRKVYAVDVAPPEKTGFWRYIGPDPRAEYIVVRDFSLTDVPDNSIDYFFSFGVFCHLRPEMCEKYIVSLASKMRPGAHGFLMVADFDKFARCMANADHLTLGRIFETLSSKYWKPVKYSYMATWRFFRSGRRFSVPSKADSENLAGCGTNAGWYHWGADAACAWIRQAGFTVVDSDMELVSRDPIIHFMR